MFGTNSILNQYMTYYNASNRNRHWYSCLQTKIINYINCLELCRKHVLNVVGILNVLNQ